MWPQVFRCYLGKNSTEMMSYLAIKEGTWSLIRKVTISSVHIHVKRNYRNLSSYLICPSILVSGNHVRLCVFATNNMLSENLIFFNSNLMTQTTKRYITLHQNPPKNNYSMECS